MNGRCASLAGWCTPRALLALSLALVASARAELVGDAARPIPAEAFYRHAEIDSASLSPSGRWLAIKTGLGGERTGIVAIDLAKGGAPQQTVRFGNADVRSFEWVNDGRLVFGLVDEQSGGGAQHFASGLFSVRPDGSELRMLAKVQRLGLSLLGGPGREPLEWNHVLLSVPAGGGGEDVIVGELKFDSHAALNAINPLRMNAATGRTESLATNAPPGVTRWLFDPEGQPRVAQSTRNGRQSVYWRGADDKEWTLLSESDWLAPAFSPEFVDATGRLFVTTPDGPGGTDVLDLFDFATNKPAANPFVKTPGFDFTGSLVTDPENGRTLGLRIWTDAATTVWFDDAMKAAQKAVDARLPGRINLLSCARCAKVDSVILVHSFSDQDPGHYWIYRPDGARWQDIGPERTGIEPRRMARLDFHRMRTRDGRDMPVWITTPSGPKAAAGRPAVVLVHGGPWVRGVYWGWYDDAQFLASRGYLVIEPEFRGSAGYGRDHFKAGFKQWGLAMQDDVADAVQWAVEKGLADGKRVCIAGASYGGYATLMGLARHPDLYRCGVAWVAVTDPRLMFELDWISDVSEEAKKFGYGTMVGDPVKDREKLTAVAPVELASRIKAPLLLAAGAKDRRVPLEHADRMREALHAAGNDPEWVLYPDEGHGWFLVADRVDFAERVERFLAKQLKP